MDWISLLMTDWVSFFVVLAICGGVIYVFGKELLELLCRVPVFLAGLWLASVAYRCVTGFLLETGLMPNPTMAKLSALAVIVLLCWWLMRGWSRQVAASPQAPQGWQAVAVDLGRTGIVVVMAMAVLMTLACLAGGTTLVISWVWLTVLAVILSGVDVCCPTLAGRAVRFLS